MQTGQYKMFLSENNFSNTCNCFTTSFFQVIFFICGKTEVGFASNLQEIFRRAFLCLTTEAYLGPCQPPMIELFSKIDRLLEISYFHQKKTH